MSDFPAYSLLDELPSEAGAPQAPAPAAPPAGPSYTGLDQLPSENAITAPEVGRQYLEQPGRLFPFAQYGYDIAEYDRLIETSFRVQGGTATPEDERWVLERMGEADRPKTFGAQVSSILLGMPAFMGEFFLTGGASKLAAGGLKMIGSAAFREAVERSAQRMGRRSIGIAAEKLARQQAARGLGGRAAAAGQDVALRLIAQEAAAAPFGGGMVTASTMREMLPELGLTEDQAGRLHIQVMRGAGGFLENLPKGVADAFIEYASEMAGPAITRGLARVPVLNKVAAAQLKVFERLAGKVGADKALEQLAKAGWNGPIQEYLEEIAGAAARELTPGIEGHFPGLQESAAMLTAFTVPGAAAAGVARAVGQGIESQPQRTTEGPAAPPTEEGEAPGEGFVPEALREPATEATARKAVQAAAWLEPPTEAAVQVSSRFSGIGTSAVWFRGGDGAPAAATLGPDLVALNAAYADQPQRYLWHELVHVLRHRSEADFQALARQVAAADPEGFAAAARRFEADFRAQMAGRLGEGLDLAVEAQRQEEATAIYAETLARWLEALEEGGPEALETLQRADRGLWEALYEAVRSLAAGMGIELPELARAGERAAEAELARMVHGVLGQMRAPAVAEGASAAPAQRQRSTSAVPAPEAEPARMPTEEALFGEQERPVRERAEVGAPEVAQGLLLDVRPEDVPGQTSLLEAAEAAQRQTGAQEAQEARKLERQRRRRAADFPVQRRTWPSGATEYPETVIDYVVALGGLDMRKETALRGEFWGRLRPKAAGRRGMPRGLVWSPDSSRKAEGLSVDDMLEALAEQGFEVDPTDAGHFPRPNADMLLDWIEEELGGAPHYLPAVATERGVQRMEEAEAEREAFEQARLAEWRSTQLERGLPPFALAPSGDAPPFYSALERGIAEMQQRKFSAKQLDAMARKIPGVTDEELEWVGWEELLGSRARVTKEEALEWVRAHQVEVRESVLGANEGAVNAARAAYEDAQARLGRARMEVESAAANYGPRGPRLQRLTSVDEYGEGRFAEETDGFPADLVALMVEARRIHREANAATKALRALAEMERIDQDAVFERYAQRRFARPYADLSVQEQRAVEREYDIDQPSPAKYGDYQLPGGERYRELLLTLPAREDELPDKYRVYEDPRYGWTVQDETPGLDIPFTIQGGTRADAIANALHALGLGQRFTSGHFDDANVLAHVRFNERTDAEGRRTLFIEEVQSDWHQEGRKKGYKQKDAPLPPRVRWGEVEVIDADTDWIVRAPDGREMRVSKRAESAVDGAEAHAVTRWNDERRRMRDEPGRGVPDAPFKRSWPTLALKRMVKWAADNGFESVAWTTGAQQVERYETQLRRVVDQLEWNTHHAVPPVRMVRVIARAEGGTGFGVSTSTGMIDRGPDEWIGNPLEDIVGKAIAERILSEESGTIAEEGLVIGGKGMQDFYDKILVNAANKLGKRFGVKVGRAKIHGPLGQLAPPRETKEQLDRMGGVAMLEATPWAVMDGKRLVSLHATAAEASAELDAGRGDWRVDLRDHFEEGYPVHALPITDDMRATVRERGFTTFGPKFALREPQPAPERTRVSRFLETWVDAWHPVKEALDLSAMRGATFTEAANVWLLERLRRGRTGREIRKFRAQHILPMRDAMRAADLSVEDVGRHMQYRGAEERDAVMASRDPAVEYGSGFTPDRRKEHEAWLDTLTDEQRTALGELEGRWDTVWAAIREKWVGYGLETQEFVDQLEETYKRYSPYRGFADEESLTEQLGWGRGIALRGGETRRAFGRESEARNPFSDLLADIERTMVRGEKARVDRGIRDYHEQVDEEFRFGVLTTDVPRETRQIAGREIAVPTREYLERKDVVPLRIDGADVFLELEPGYEHLGPIMRNETLLLPPEYLRWAARLTRALAALSTRYNPFFAPFNLIRDFGQATLSLLSERGAGFAAKTAAHLAVNAPAYARAWTKFAKDANAEAVTPAERVVKEYLDSGAEITFLDLAGAEEAVRELDRTFSEPRPGVEAFRALGFHLSNMQDVIENWTRISAFAVAREEGMSRDKAAFLAKNLTTNFEQKGTLGVLLNSFWMFANAGIQGNRRLYEALSKGAFGRRVLFGTMGGALLIDALNAAISDDDEDGESFYDRIPEYEKRTNLILMVPGSTTGDYVKIPLPYGFNVLHSAGTTAGHVMRGIWEPKFAAAEAWEAAVDAFNPLGGGTDLAEVLTPTLLDPVIQAARNRAWHGGPIIPPYQVLDRRLPDSEKFYPSVNPMAKRLARWANQATLGTPTEPGFADVSPETIEHVLQAYTGGVGAEAQRIAKMPFAEDIWPRSVPLVRRVVGKQRRDRHRARFSQNKLELDRLKLAYDQADLEGQQRLVKEDGRRLAMRALFLRTARDATRLRQYRDKLTDSAGREALDERIAGLYVRANRVYREVPK